MFLTFESEYVQEYIILRDYFVSSKDIDMNGIQFIISNKESGEIKDIFLEKKFLNNMFAWEKTKKDDIEFVSYGIERGPVNKLIIETGFVQMKKKFSKDQITNHPAKKYRYILKENI